MLTEACNVWEVAVYFCFVLQGFFFCSFPKHYLIWPWVEFAGTATPRKTECFPFVGRKKKKSPKSDGLQIVWKWPPRSVGSQNCAADVLPPWHHVNIQLNEPDHQNVFFYRGDRLIQCIWLAALRRYLSP